MKRGKRALVLVMCAMAILSLAACGAGEKHTLGGEYVLEKVRIGDGKEMTLEEYYETFEGDSGTEEEGTAGIEMLASIQMSMTFEDGIFTVNVLGMTIEGTYTQEGDQVTCTSEEGVALDFTYDAAADELETETDGITIIFVGK